VTVGGISSEKGFSDYDYKEATLLRTMINVSKEVIVLADHSKFGIESFCRIAPLEAADVIVTGRGLPNKWMSTFKEKGITLITSVEMDS